MEKKAKKHLSKWQLIMGLGIGVLVIYFIATSEEGGKQPAPEQQSREFQYHAEYGVASYLKANLRDPKSYEKISWGNVSAPLKDGSRLIRHKYRAKNGFGGYNIEDKIFTLDANWHVDISMTVEEFKKLTGD